jgi:ATP-binding cassette subfamily B protein/subfamily B ATP-binding cassette protein MsbA
MAESTSSKQKARQFVASLRKGGGAAAADPSGNGDAGKTGGRPDAGKADGSKSAPSPNRRKYLREYIRWLWPYRMTIGSLFFMALIVAGLDMIWPLAIKWIINSLVPGHARVSLDGIGIGLIFVLLLKQAVEGLRTYRSAALNAKVVFRLRRRLFNRLLHLPLMALADMKSGGITSRLSTDIDNISGLVQSAVLNPAVAALRVVLTICILMVLSWRLAIGAMVLIPPMALLSFFWLGRVRPIYRSAQKDRIDVDGRVNETFGGIRVVRAFRREAREARAYGVAHHTIIRKRLFAQALELVLESGWGLLIPFTALLIVWYGGYLVLRGHANVGDLFAFQIYAVLLLQPVWQIVSSISVTQRSLTAMERVFDVLRMDADKPDAPDAAQAPRLVRELEFDHVDFEYRPGVAVIRDFSLKVPGGSVVALVGPSGAGKTTLTDLVARFHDPTAGAILLNGIDLRQIRLRGYRSMLAIVQQDVFLFDGTVRQNIAYGRPKADAQLVEDAARRANAHEFIVNLPDGYETLIGERGFKLSGGQRQRLSIARAILADPQILILDEATSNLDTESEQLIQSSLYELFKGRTTFVIAHRLSTVSHADTIVVLDRGAIQEIGPHDDLMSRHGLYYEMVSRQRDSLKEAEAASPLIAGSAA